MLGNRDSEIAAVVRDQDYIDSTMNGVPYKVSRFAHTLRMNLMTEHLGLSTGHDHCTGPTGFAQGDALFSELDFVDPVHPAFFEDIWKYYAESNTKIFRDMFKCIPDNTVTDWSQYKKFNAQSNVDDPRIQEERTLKDKAINKILGPTLSERFKPGDDSGDEEEDDDDMSGDDLENDRSKPARAAKKALANDDSDSDEDLERDEARDERIINSDLSREDLVKSKDFKNKDLRTDGKVTAKQRAMEKSVGSFDQQQQRSSGSKSQDSTTTFEQVGSPQMQREAVKRTASALAQTNDVRLAMESDLSKVQGHLVEWPLDFLRDELESYNFCYPKDYNHPIDLYT